MIASVSNYLQNCGDFKKAPNIFMTPYIAAHLLGDHIDFSVIHGGEGTVQTACLSGKPFVGILLQYEQEVNVRNCEQYGNAIYLAPENVSQ